MPCAATANFWKRWQASTGVLCVVCDASMRRASSVFTVTPNGRAVYSSPVNAAVKAGKNCTELPRMQKNACADLSFVPAMSLPWRHGIYCMRVAAAKRLPQASATNYFHLAVVLVAAPEIGESAIPLLSHILRRRAAGKRVVSLAIAGSFYKEMKHKKKKKRSWWHWGLWRQALPVGVTFSSIKGLALPNFTCRGKHQWRKKFVR